MYAITFDVDTNRMQEVYPGDSWRNGCQEIKNLLKDHGFTWTQGSVYFGDERVTVVSCVLAIQDVTRRLDWFAAAVRDVRMLRIEENNDLGPAVEVVAS